MSEIRINPRKGWVRADQARSDEDVKRETDLQKALATAEKQIRALERKVRDRRISLKDVPSNSLASGKDLFYFKVTYKDKNQQVIAETVSASWDEIFTAIGPSMYGYLIRKLSSYNNDVAIYSFERNIEDMIREKIVDRVQGRAIKIQTGQMDRCVIHLKQLGLVMFEQKEAKDGTVFRGLTLTEYGEQYLTLQNVVRKD
jgi:hypothetical protein